MLRVAMNVPDLIARKRDGLVLTDEEIRWLISAYTSGEVADYQMAALAMAIFLNGLAPGELTAWTDAMLHSGDVLDLSDIDLPKVDKHSTGGVGDKVSIPLAPIVAACGVAVPMMSGRGLGHTGGTLDKLESIPGLSTSLSTSEFQSVLERCGFVMAGQTERLVPADRELYALRDSTATVSSIPLIASSIMSKKLAEDLDGLVLDVKVGSGAFMTEVESARKLAETMVDLGRRQGVSTTAFVTAMNQPLGKMVGNSLEIIESIGTLRGNGPPDLWEVTRTLSVAMVDMAGIPDGEARVDSAIETGSALARFEEMIRAQGGDPAVIDNHDILPLASGRTPVKAPAGGHVTVCDAYKVGVAAMRLGAGRTKKDDSIDPGVGVELIAKVGDQVAEDEPLAFLIHTDAPIDEAHQLLTSAYEIESEPSDAGPLILKRIDG